MRANAGNWSARLAESISSIQLNAGLGHLLGSELQCVSDARREGRSMQHAHSGTRLIVGEGRGGRVGVSAVPCWSVSASLLSVHVCHSFDPLDLQDRTVTGKLRPEEDSDANHVHVASSSPRRVAEFVRISVEKKLPTHN